MRFLANLKRRSLTLARAVKKFVGTDDELALQEKTPGLLQLRRTFEFHTDADKLTAFNEWFARQVSGGFLAPDAGTPAGAPWTTQYVESAYKRGQINAYLSTRASSFVDEIDIASGSQAEFLRQSFAAPETISKLRLLGTRSFEQLKGFTGAMGAETNRILSQGIADGSNPRAVAKVMTDRIAGLTRQRAEVIARTEIIHAHAEGQLDAFTQLGVKELGLMAEWSTAGDDRVCPDCFGREGQLFTVEEARGLIPLHPQCRCTWIPTPAPDKADLTAADRKAARRANPAPSPAATPTPARPPTPSSAPALPPPAPVLPPQTLKQQMDEVLKAPKHQFELGGNDKIRANADMLGEIAADKATRELLKLRRPGKRHEGDIFATKVKNPVLKKSVAKAEEFLKDILPASRFQDLPTIVTKRKGGRAAYSPRNKALNMPTDRPPQITVHEFGHHMQHTDAQIMLREKAFLRRRADIKPSSRVQAIGGRANGTGFPADFAAKGGNAYTGRIYGQSRPFGGELDWQIGEVTTMGIQRLYEAPARFFREDPDFFQFIVDSISKGFGVA